MPSGDFPDTNDLLELYGVGEYVVGGGATLASNPFTGQPWTRADLNTLVVGFWVRWSNKTFDPQVPQLFGMNDFGVEVVHNGIVLTLTTLRLDVSTGDTGRFLTTTTPSSTSISPTFTVGSYTNPNSSCEASINFAASSGVGTINSVVTAAPEGCSRIADNVRSNVGSNQSTNSAKVVVPPQIMIRMVVSEAGGQPADLDQQAVLVSARNRFGKRDFPGGRTATWQSVLVPQEYDGLQVDNTQNGPDQELRNAAKVFAGEIGDLVAGSDCYWSPMASEWPYVQQALQSGTKVYPDRALTGAPDCWDGRAQIVYKASIGLNSRTSPEWQNVPAFVFVRLKTDKNAPAAIQIP